MKMFSKEECLYWKNQITHDKKCCSQPDIRCVAIQRRSKDEMSTLYRLCINCNKKFYTKNV